MDIAARKSKLIEEFKKINDTNLISKLENLLTSESKNKSTHNLHKFIGIWPDKDVEEMKKAINDPLLQSDIDEVNEDFKFSD